MQKLCNIGEAHVDEYKRYLEDNKIKGMKGISNE